MSYIAHRTYPAKILGEEDRKPEPPAPIVVLNCSSNAEAMNEAEAIVRRAGATRIEFEPRAGGAFACLGFAQ